MPTVQAEAGLWDPVYRHDGDYKYLNPDLPVEGSSKLELVRVRRWRLQAGQPRCDSFQQEELEA